MFSTNRLFSHFTLVGVMGSAIIMGGCSTDPAALEHDALTSQNDNLYNQVEDAQAQLDKAELEKARLRQQIKNAESAISAARLEAARAKEAADKARAEAEAAAVAKQQDPNVDLLPAFVAGGVTGFDRIAGVETESSPSQVVVRVPGDVLFDSGSAELKGTTVDSLDQIAGVIKSDYSDKSIRIEGYTDPDPIRHSPWADNLQLSAERAAAVHRYLQDQGVPPEKMHIAGFGQWKPREDKARSRRVEIVVLASHDTLN